MTNTTEARVIVPADLIGAAEAARMLELERSTLTRWIHGGKIKPLAQLDGKRGAYVFDRSDVEALAQGKQES